jgi:hypothetical protein
MKALRKRVSRPPLPSTQRRDALSARVAEVVVAGVERHVVERRPLQPGVDLAGLQHAPARPDRPAVDQRVVRRMVQAVRLQDAHDQRRAAGVLRRHADAPAAQVGVAGDGRPGDEGERQPVDVSAQHHEVAAGLPVQDDVLGHAERDVEVERGEATVHLVDRLDQVHLRRDALGRAQPLADGDPERQVEVVAADRADPQAVHLILSAPSASSRPKPGTGAVMPAVLWQCQASAWLLVSTGRPSARSSSSITAADSMAVQLST